MTIDHTTAQAIRHTVHCLIGCGIGEVLGMYIAAMLGWHGVDRILLAVGLAFLFGYSLTYWSVRKHAKSTSEAVRTTLATDTVSIATMETVANVIAFATPGALMAMPHDPHFWVSLTIAMGIAFIVTVPVNRYLISRDPHAHHHHH